MNILVIGKFYSEGFALHIAETLAAMCHAVRRFEPGIRSDWIGGKTGYRIDKVRRVLFETTDNLPTIRARRMKALWRVAEQGPLDAVIVCHDFLWPREVFELKRRTGAVVAMWFPDHISNFAKGYFMNAPYDGVFFKDPYIVKVLSGVVSSPVYFLPECFNPDRHLLPDEEVSAEEYRCDITTAGNFHSWRVAVFRHLADYDVKLWGNPPPLWMPTGPVNAMHQGRVVLNEDKARAFLGAKILLNNLSYQEIWGLNARAFEAAGIGAFQIVDWRPYIEQLFVDGKELVTFKSMEELKRLIDFYLPREEERRAIAEAGKRRALAEHTYQHRLDLLLDTLDGSMQGYAMPQIPTYNSECQ